MTTSTTSSIGSTMRALVLRDVQQFELSEIPLPALGAREVRIRVGAVGLCGTDFHIFEGHANYTSDATGKPIPLTVRPQILGHEFCGTVVETGSEVSDLRVGDRVVGDQGLNCHSYDQPLCEYCATGNSHQCADYREHGITGLQGALAEYLSLPAVNAVKIESDLPLDQAVMTEPLSCVTHAMEMLQSVPARYRFGGESPIKSVLVCGAGPAGLLFTQLLRQVIGFEGLLIVTEPNPLRRALAESYGATTIDPTQTDLVMAVNELTHGERLQCLIESAGVARLFPDIPNLIRKQASMVLYGHGHHGVDLGVLNRLQFIEPTLVTPTGASGGFDADRRPAIYRRSLGWLSEGRIDVSRIVTDHYRTLDDVPRGFGEDRLRPEYIKGVAYFD